MVEGAVLLDQNHHCFDGAATTCGGVARLRNHFWWWVELGFLVAQKVMEVLFSPRFVFDNGNGGAWFYRQR